MANNKVWFITGSSRGFGRIWVEAALQRGDKVAATARNTDSLKDLVAGYGECIFPLQLDVTDRDACFAAIKKSQEHFGRLDIVINNAGYGQFGGRDPEDSGQRQPAFTPLSRNDAASADQTALSAAAGDLGAMERCSYGRAGELSGVRSIFFLRHGF